MTRAVALGGRERALLGASHRRGIGLVVAGTICLVPDAREVLGPLLAWAVVGESPPPFAAAGGLVVVVTLALHSLRSLAAVGANVGRR